MDSLHALHANHGAQVSVSRTHPQGMVGRPHGQHCNIGTLGLEPRVLPVSYGPGFFLLGEPLPWSARDPSRLVLLNCVVVCHLATPTCRCAVHGFETAVGRDLLAVGDMCQSGEAPSHISRVDRFLPVLFRLVVVMAILDVPQFMEV